MIPSIRDLIANLEGYKNDSGKGEAVNHNEENLNYLAMMLWMSDIDEKITKIQEDYSNNSAATGFLAILTIIEWVAIIYLFVSR